MAKRRHEEVQETSSKTAMAMMIAGGLAVAALVVWALTRTVQPAPEPSVATSAPVTIEQPTTGTTTVPPLDPGMAGTSATSATSAPQLTPPAAVDPNALVARTSVADLRAKIDAKQVTVIDVRDKTSYMGSHIPGSLNVPVAQMESQVSFLPKDKPIVTYCT